MSINPEYTKYNLSNGMKIILYPRKEIHSVTLRANVNIGSLDESKEESGISHFIEHVVHEGTARFKTWEAVEDFKTDYSASTNAYTSTDHTQYYGTFPFQYIEQAIIYFAEIIFHPLFKEEDVNKQRDIILDELSSYEDETDYLLIKNVKDSRFVNTDTPFSADVIGTKANLNSFQRQHLVNHWKKHYNPKNVELYILGNFNIEKVKTLLKKYCEVEVSASDFDEVPKREFREKYPAYSNFKINTTQKLDLDKYYLAATFPSYEFKLRKLQDRYKVSFLQAMTASSSYMHSVLWKSLRQDRGIVYGVHCWNYDMFTRDTLGISTSFDKSNLETVLRELYKGLNQIKKAEISDNVFESKKRKVLDTQRMQLDKPETAINWISSLEDEIEEHGSGFKLSEYLEFVKNLKFEEVIEVANEIYDWGKLNIGVVSSDKKEDVKLNLQNLWSDIIK